MIKFTKKTKGAFASLIAVTALSGQVFAEDMSETTKSLNKQTILNQESNESINSVEWYGGIGFNSVKAEDVTFGVVGKVGYDFTPYIGVEGRVIKTMRKQKVEHMGVFAKPMLPVTESLNVYGLLGYGKTSTDNKKEFDDSGIAWGIGLNYYFGDNIELEELNGQLMILKEQLKEQERKSLKDIEIREMIIRNIEEIQEEIDNFDGGRGFGIFVDYERLLQKSDSPDFDSFSIGLSYDF